jgi:hypothetical protein
MEVRKRSRNIGAKCAAAAIVLALAVCGVRPASAEDTTSTGNRVFSAGAMPDSTAVEAVNCLRMGITRQGRMMELAATMSGRGRISCSQETSGA